MLAGFEALLALSDPAIKSGGPGEQARGGALVGGSGGGGEEEFEEERGGDGVDYSTDVLYWEEAILIDLKYNQSTKRD